MKQIISILLLFTLCNDFRAQSYNTQRGRVLTVNLLSNAIIGGIGSAVHKQKTEKAIHAFAKGFLKGSVGGLIKYNAKSQCFFISQPMLVMFAPINRLYYFLGHSVVMNAAYNRKMFSRFYCNMYGVDLQMDWQAEHKIKARLSVATLASAVFLAGKGFELDVYRSLEYGQLLFLMKPGQMGIYNGKALFNCMVVEARHGQPDMSVISHEMLHTYQSYDYFGLNAIYSNRTDSLLKKNKLLKTFSKYLIADYECLFMVALYAPQFRLPPDYFKNYFEFEAEHFSSRQYVKR